MPDVVSYASTRVPAQLAAVGGVMGAHAVGRLTATLKVSGGHRWVMTDDASPEDDAAYACRMTGEEEAREQAGRLQALFDAASAIEAIEGGLRLEIPREDDLAQAAADFAALESWCCPWARYELAFERGREGIVLEVTGDEEVAELIQQYPAGEIPEGLETPELPDGFEVEQPGVERSPAGDA